MTHLFSTTLNEMIQLSQGTKRFDILKFGRPISVGDTILYQLEHLETEEGEDAEPEDKSIPQEYYTKIDFIFDDSEGALKKGYIAVQFREEI